MSDQLALYIIIGLSILLVGQQVYWLVNVQRLMNKIMSKNYVEYAQGEVIRTPPQERLNLKNDTEIVDDFSVAQADKANKLFGFGGR